jgi:hypothetical protein
MTWLFVTRRILFVRVMRTFVVVTIMEITVVMIKNHGRGFMGGRQGRISSR